MTERLSNPTPSGQFSRRSVLGMFGLAGGALALSPALAACGEGGGAASAGGKFVLGEVHATTGPAASTYRNYFIPANLAVKDINADGGIDGATIEEKLLDDAADPAKEPGVFRQFSQEKVKYVIGPNTSSTCLAAVPLATSFKMLNLNVSTSDLLDDPEQYPYSFLIGPTNTPACNAIVDYCAAQGWNRVALLHSDDQFGQQTVDPITARGEEKGVELVAAIEHPVQATDMTPYVQQAKNAKPDAVICIQAIVATQTSMMNAFKNLDLLVPILGTTSISSETLRVAAPPEVYKNVYAVYLKNYSYNASEEPPQKTLDYLERVTAEVGNFGGLTTAGMVYGPYDFIHMLKAAVEKVGSAADVDKVVKALEDMDTYEGVTGKISFSAESHNGLADDDLVICKAVSGGDAKKSMGGFLLERA